MHDGHTHTHTGPSSLVEKLCKRVEEGQSAPLGCARLSLSWASLFLLWSSLPCHASCNRVFQPLSMQWRVGPQNQSPNGSPLLWVPPSSLPPHFRSLGLQQQVPPSSTMLRGSLKPRRQSRSTVLQSKLHHAFVTTTLPFLLFPLSLSSHCNMIWQLVVAVSTAVLHVRLAEQVRKCLWLQMTVAGEVDRSFLQLCFDCIFIGVPP